jgi:hypothetical protein
MRNLKNRFSLCFLALALFASSAAQAGPTYHVSVDTGGFTGQGLMDFTFLANAGATPATAILTNFDGSFGATFDRSADAAGTIANGIVLGNQNGGNYLTQFVNLGGLFSFDVSFGGEFATVENVDASQFSATLYNDDLTAYIGDAGSFAEFVLVPRINGNPGGLSVLPPNGLASVTQVANIPEPSSFLLALLATAMLGIVRFPHWRAVSDNGSKA